MQELHIQADDVQQAMQQARPSVSARDHARFDNIYSRFRAARAAPAENMSAGAKGKRSTLA